ncbi:MAG: hypothetical protein NTU89_03175 [Candidatus Dependentiae bacterium]|nr:hypothetical protein [Candidatus Dependentiae bacterium]
MKFTKIRSMQSIMFMAATLQIVALHGMMAKTASGAAGKALSPALQAAYASLGLNVGANPKQVSDAYQQLISRTHLSVQGNNKFNSRDIDLSKYETKSYLDRNAARLGAGQPSNNDQILKLNKAFHEIKNAFPRQFEGLESADPFKAEREQRLAREALEKANRNRFKSPDQIAHEEALEKQATENASNQAIESNTSNGLSSLKNSVMQELKNGDMVQFFSGLSAIKSFGGDVDKIIHMNHDLILKQVMDTIRSTSGRVGLDSRYIPAVVSLSLQYRIFDSAEDFAHKLMQTPRVADGSESQLGLVPLSKVVESLFNSHSAESLKDALIVYNILLENKYIVSSFVNDPLKKAAERSLFGVVLGSINSLSGENGFDRAVQEVKKSLELLNDFENSNIVSSVKVQNFLSGPVASSVQNIINEDYSILSLDQKEIIANIFENKGVKLSFDAQVQKVNKDSSIKLASDKKHVGVFMNKGQLDKLEDVWNNSSSQLKEYIRATVLENVVSNIGKNNPVALKTLKFGLTRRMFRMGQITSSKRFLDLVSKQGPEEAFGNLFDDCQSLQDYKIVTILLDTLVRDNIVSASQRDQIKSELTDSMISKNTRFIISSKGDADLTSWIEEIDSQISWLSDRGLVDDARVRLVLGEEIARFAKAQTLGRRLAMRILLAAVTFKWIAEAE